MTLAATPEERAGIRSDALRSVRPKRRGCKHSWGPWQDWPLSQLQRRDCHICGRIQNRDPG